jgi:hypothetical protein
VKDHRIHQFHLFLTFCGNGGREGKQACRIIMICDHIHNEYITKDEGKTAIDYQEQYK